MVAVVAAGRDVTEHGERGLEAVRGRGAGRRTSCSAQARSTSAGSPGTVRTGSRSKKGAPVATTTS